MKKVHLLIIVVISLSAGFMVSSVVYDPKPVKLEAGSWFGEQAKVLPNFQLVDQNSRALGKAELVGKWSLMFFGYTHCPDVCPTSLQILSDLLNTIDGSNIDGKIQVIFVSVDPARDTPAILKTYVQYFHRDIIGASAPLIELDRLTSSIGIAHSRDINNGSAEVYDVSHSSAIILLNPRGEFSGLFGAPHDSQAMARDMAKIIDNS